MKKLLLGKEEVMLENEIEKGEWVAVPGMAEEVEKYRTYARQALKKDRKINIRMSAWDYNNIKQRAAQEGLPYQTLVSSIIHKYLIGKMKAS